MSNSVHDLFGDRVRVRVCGICPMGNGIVMVNHKGLRNGNFWAPPGGGIEFGENALECLKREMKEETGLEVEAGEFLFLTEYFDSPLHAIELFFLVVPKAGPLMTGSDPEMVDNQIIIESKVMPWKEIEALDKQTLHGIFKILQNPSEILRLRGYFKL
jgi:ADP-ribose pyrophosphatase